MKRTAIIFTALFISVSLLGLFSCRKETLDTPFTRILGKWKKYKYATDDNANGKIDTREIFLVESGVTNEFTFKPDSSGVETTTSSPDLNFKWKIIGTKSVLVQYNANDTVVYTIENISSVDMTLITETKLGLAWYYYIKE